MGGVCSSWRHVWAALSLALCVSGAGAQEATTNGVVALDARWFAQDAPFVHQRRHGYAGVLEIEQRWRRAADAVSVRAYLRADQTGEYVDLREAYWQRDAGNLSLRLGFQKVFWGVMESNHLIDIVNQTDLASDPDGEDKFGQPMLTLGWAAGELGRFEVLYLPYFRERLFPGRKARLRADPPVAQRSTWWRAGRWHPDYVARWSNSLDVADLGLYVFRGLSREPDLALGATDQGMPVLLTSYRPITQWGADFQVPHGSMMWKGELLHRRGHGRPFSALSLGGEYTWPLQAGDLGLIAEWSRDRRDASAPASNFSNALFGGLRFRMNNQHDSEFLLGHQMDRSNDLRFWSMELNHRLSDRWKLQIEGKKFLTLQATPYPLNILQDENYLQAKLSYYF